MSQFGTSNFGQAAPTGQQAPGAAYNPQQVMKTAQSGYNNALGSLQSSLQASANTTHGQQMQLGTQLAQNQGKVSQDLANRGLGNTTVAQTMQQAPLATYNQGMANVGDLDAQRQMSAYGNIANMQAGGGQAMAGLMQPYAQTGVANQYAQYQQLMQAQNAASAQAQQQTNGAFQQANAYHP